MVMPSASCLCLRTLPRVTCHSSSSAFSLPWVCNHVSTRSIIGLQRKWRANDGHHDWSIYCDKGVGTDRSTTMREWLRLMKD